jgi:hypothetical protein
LLKEELGRYLVRDMVNYGSSFKVVAGDQSLPIADSVLQEAGIYDEDYGPLSSAVKGYLGEVRVDELKERFGDNWEVAAAYEYCLLMLPHNSPAFIAASYRYAHYISEDDFSAGYYWRDLEVLFYGVEAEATRAIETRRKAGAGGSKKSAQAREDRRSALMSAIENVAQENPAFVRLGEAGLARLALDDAVQANPTLWKQGKGQVEEYLGEIRRGEAGQDLKERYQALFGRKAPKRF